MQNFVYLLGWIEEEDIPALYEVMDVYVHNSHFETFGFVIAEAMMHGLPILATRSSGAAKDVVEHKTNGYLYDYLDNKELLNGIKFYLGDDSGLQHSFTDTDVINGQKYYYAVVAYDFGGDESNNIIPSDSPMRLRINSLTGELETGSNVVEVIPREPAAGYIKVDTNTDIQHFGLSDGQLSYEVMDPMNIVNDHTYRVTFSDSAYYTEGYFLIDITDNENPDTLINNYDITELYQPIIDGFSMNIENIDMIRLDSFYWTSDSLWDINVAIRDFKFVDGTRVPADYRVIFSDSFIGLSECYCAKRVNETLDPCSEGVPENIAEEWCSELAHLYHPSQTNFIVQKKIYDSYNQDFYWADIPYAFYDVFPSLLEPDNFFNADTVDFDYLMFLDDVDDSGRPLHSWVVNLAKPEMGDPYRNCCSQPQSGDTLYIDIKKPFLSSDVYEFTPQGPYIDTHTARDRLQDIIVVPNPYQVQDNSNPIEFRNLTRHATIRIYNSAGELIERIEHHGETPTERWDGRVMDGSSIMSGIYIYHVEAPRETGRGRMSASGMFAVIR